MTGDYLWDGTGWPDPEVRRLERVLGRLKYQPTAPPWPEARSRSWTSAVALLAAAAMIVVLVGLTWWINPASRASLEARRLDGTPTIGTRPLTTTRRLPAGGWLVTDSAARAALDIASVGRVEIEPDTQLGLISTRPGDHRLQLTRGTMQAVIWAPPGQVSVRTPSSTAVDLGCIYTMHVDDEGIGVVQVAAGWVGFEWRGRESFIPAGAVCVTRPGLGPGTPHYDDTSDAFRAALATIDVGRAPIAARVAAIDLVLAEARPRDVFTLWHLLSRVPLDQRDKVFTRLAGFVPPPGGVTRDGIREGRQHMLDAWWDALNLGTSAWWRIWIQQWRPR